MNYRILRTQERLPLSADWSHSAWQKAETLEVSNFRPESNAHHPQTFARLLFGDEGIHGMFHVRDEYVRCRRTNYFDEVWKDSCVEFFAEPKAGQGYFNFEFNCGGAFLCCHILDPARVRGGFKKFVPVPPEIGKTIQVRSSLLKIIEPEVTEPLQWTLQFFIPFAVFEGFIGPLGNVAGRQWRGNFFKCAEEVSRPHWASWSPVDEFNFHLPRCFGTLSFA